ncbi:hypothetical protein [uncultured Paludibaculum sp.]|uniref:hypothetical protein n=1 Tax=uncultured Paludibaculum sp. TaxID=1765020 RepID=UPI002AAB636F|nr:hypothetical protein [uncultured Paludibaculum sp.]
MNKLTSLFLAATLAIIGLTPAYAKSYDFSLAVPTTAGTVQLEPGRYSLKVEGDKAIITLEKNNKSVEVPVKIKQGDKKFRTTSVGTVRGASSSKLTSIELGGSKTTLEFGQ